MFFFLFLLCGHQCLFGCLSTLAMTSRVFGASTAAARKRQHYLQILREKAREAVSESSVLTSDKGAFSWSRINSHHVNLHLPEKWMFTCITRLQSSLAGVVPKEKILSNDMYLCALIHPTFVPLHSARSAVAMPIELTLTGSSTLRLLREVAALHGMQGVLQTEEIANISHGLNVEDLLLYDKVVFAESLKSPRPPEEVRLAAGTALCGAVALSEGVQSASDLLEILRGTDN